MPDPDKDYAWLVEKATKARINLMHLSANLGLSEDADVLDAGAVAIEQLLAALASREGK